jgi:hypothetical protein
MTTGLFDLKIRNNVRPTLLTIETTPTSGTDAVNKQYVDTTLLGFVKTDLTNFNNPYKTINSATAPTSPLPGNLWLNTNNGKVYVYYNGQWIQPSTNGSGATIVEYRTFDGTSNHPTVPLRNTAGGSFTRYPVNSYTDGVWAMRTDLPNPRTVSNVVVQGHGTDADPNGYSGMMYAWGQFITHDMGSQRVGSINIDVIVPPGDTGLTPGSHIPVTRLALVPGTGTNGVTARFINDVTGWLDSSVVYGVAYPQGVTPVTAFANPVTLREGGAVATTGKLLTTNNGLYGPVVNGQFVFGDPRGTENPDLTALQTLFIREHNWHVTRLTAQHPDWTGEQLYQQARSIVMAEMQNITFTEWLPKIVGADAIPAYTGYKPEIDASIKIEFDAAALRFGHSIVSNALDRIDEAGNVTETLNLFQAFFLTPAQFERNGGADGFIRKLCADISNKLDVHIVEDLRNFLNDPPAALDLAATNIQRGRDAGLPSLNQMRVALGLPAYTQFSQINSDPTTAAALQTAYVDINKIDLWIGGLAETPYPGAMVGPTFRAIIVDQMTRLRDGDRLYFENQGWARGDLAWLKGTTLADIILRNTDTVHLQRDVFVAVERSDLFVTGFPLAVARTWPGINFPYDNNGLAYAAGDTAWAWNGSGWDALEASFNVNGDVHGVSDGHSIFLRLNPTGVTPGTYTKLTVDNNGRITAGTALSSSDVTTALGYTPLSTGGGTVTGPVTFSGIASVTASPTDPNQIVNKAYIDSKIWLALAVGL